MPKRRSTSGHDVPACTKAPSVAPSLLTLPPEIRCMIWKAVVELPILLFTTKHSLQAPVQVISFWSKALGPDYIEAPCTKLHQDQAHRTDKGPGPLSWLRTNRQVYTEAQPVVCQNLSLHVCDPILLEAVISNRLPKKNLKPEILQSLSFCLRIQLAHDTDKGYSFATDVEHGGHSHIDRGRMGGCACAWCFAYARLPNDGTELDRHFPNLKEVRLRTYFVCRERLSHYRPTIDQRQSGRLRNGRSYGLTAPSPLVWTGDRGSIKTLVDDLCDERPLGMFKGGRSKSVVVDFATRGIEHNPVNRPPHPHDRCWCTLHVDLESIPRALFTETIIARISAEQRMCSTGCTE